MFETIISTPFGDATTWSYHDEESLELIAHGYFHPRIGHASFGIDTPLSDIEEA